MKRPAAIVSATELDRRSKSSDARPFASEMADSSDQLYPRHPRMIALNSLLFLLLADLSDARGRIEGNPSSACIHFFSS